MLEIRNYCLSAIIAIAVCVSFTMPSLAKDPQPVSVNAFVTVDMPTSFVFIDAFDVPADKILVVEYVSLYLDVVVRNRPTTGLRIEARLQGFDLEGNPGPHQFRLGYMEEFVRTSRGTPNFLIGKDIKAYFGPGTVNCVADTHFAGSDLDFGAASCEIAGQLLDAN